MSGGAAVRSEPTRPRDAAVSDNGNVATALASSASWDPELGLVAARKSAPKSVWPEAFAWLAADNGTLSEAVMWSADSIMGVASLPFSPTQTG
ncbi:MAG: hypothetical protein O2968_13725 [Acidobacteria bacterium]|nr:hypothetical protein [Acidobacteriota bacterium]